MNTSSQTDLEKAVLGVCVRDGLTELVQDLDPDNFVSRTNQNVARLLLSQVTDGEPFDLVALVDAARRKGYAVQASYLASLTSTAAVASSGRAYITMLAERAYRRQIKLAASYLVDRAETDDYPEALDELRKVASRRPGTSAADPEKDLVTEVLRRGFQSGGPEEDKLATGIGLLDYYLEGGLTLGQYVLVTGPTGHGKSTLASQIALHIASRENEGVWVGSYEMSPNRTARMMMRQTGMAVDARNVDQFGDFVKQRVWVSGALGILDPAAMAREIEAYMARGVRVFVVDNLTTIEAMESGERFDKQVVLMQRILRFCLEHRVLFILLAHLRKLSHRGAPGVEDVSGAGSIGQLADAVVLMERSRAEDTTADGYATILKSRTFGMGHTVRLRFNAEYGRFFEVEGR